MRILLATDGSELSGAAVRTVAQRPWPTGSIVRVLSVAQPVYPPGELTFVGTAYEQMTKDLVEEAKKIAAKGVEALRGPGLAIESAVREGEPRREIVAEAETWGADLIVLGSHGRTGVKRWLMGSVAEHVVRHAPCSVEVARTPIKPPAENATEPERKPP